jgi:protein-disulfide isomerase
MASNEPRATRSEQREATREKARQLREANARKERSKSLVLKLSVVVGVLAAAAIVVVTILSGVNQNNAVAGGPANMIYNSGIKIGTNLEAYTKTQTPEPNPSAAASTNGQVPNIQIYIDYQCPICGMFESGNTEQLRSWVKTGAATVEIHPISFLDGRGSPNTYSSRSANAAVCVANYSPNSFFDYNAALFANQPAEGTPGPENDALVARANTIGVQNASKVADCINNNTYKKWISDTTDKVLDPSYSVQGSSIKVTGTPTIVVNGKQYTWSTEADLTSPARFAQWVQQAMK